MSDWDYDKICKYIEEKGDTPSREKFSLFRDGKKPNYFGHWDYPFAKPTKKKLSSYTEAQMAEYKETKRSSEFLAKNKELLDYIDALYVRKQ